MLGDREARLAVRVVPVRVVFVLAAAGLLLTGCAPTGQTTSWQDSRLDSELKAACAGDPSPRVKAVVNIIGPTQDRTHTIAELTKELTIGDRPGMERYKYTLGITDGEIQGETSMKIMTVGYGSQWCGKVAEASIDLSWAIRVRVARELAPGSCVFRSTVEHENKHVALDRELQPELERKLEKAVIEVTSKTSWSSSESAVKANLQRQVDQAVGPIIKAFQSERHARQLEIDTPEEYDRADTLCSADEWRAVLPK